MKQQEQKKQIWNLKTHEEQEEDHVERYAVNIHDEKQRDVHKQQKIEGLEDVDAGEAEQSNEGAAQFPAETRGQKKKDNTMKRANPMAKQTAQPWKEFAVVKRSCPPRFVTCLQSC